MNAQSKWIAQQAQPLPPSKKELFWMGCTLGVCLVLAGHLSTTEHVAQMVVEEAQLKSCEKARESLSTMVDQVLQGASIKVGEKVAAVCKAKS